MALCALVAALAIAAPASAQNCSTPTDEQYKDQTQQLEVCAEGGSGTADVSDPGNPGSLPFTGLDVGLMGVAALALVGGGVLVRRRASAREGA